MTKGMAPEEIKKGIRLFVFPFLLLLDIKDFIQFHQDQ